jgi:hypothetical protein
MWISEDVGRLESPLLKYVKTLNLSDSSCCIEEDVAILLLPMVEEGLEVFVAPTTEISWVNLNTWIDTNKPSNYLVEGSVLLRSQDA